MLNQVIEKHASLISSIPEIEVSFGFSVAAIILELHYQFEYHRRRR